MKRWGLIAAWVVALVLTTAMTWQIVSAADNRVNDRQGPPLNVAAPTSPDQTSTTESATTAPGVPVPSTGGTSSSSSSSSSTSTPGVTPPAQAQTVPIPTAGGTVTVRVAPESVTYLSAVPSPGFAVEVDDFGPPDVRVEFVSNDIEIEVRAEWADGQLVVEIDD